MLRGDQRAFPPLDWLVAQRGHPSPAYWPTDFSRLFSRYVRFPTNQLQFSRVGGRGAPMARYYFHIKDGAELIKDRKARSLRRRMPPACKP